VQKGVYYSPRVQIYLFDIWVKGHSFMNFDIFENICQKAGLIYSIPLQRGKFVELIKFNIDTFVTTLPAQFGLPPISDYPNIAEGIVLKPVINRYLTRGGRVLVKYKSENFKEVTGLKIKSTEKAKKHRDPQDLVLLSTQLQFFLDNLLRYITENRLRNVISKIGEIKRSDRSKLIGLFAKDIIKDFEEDYVEFKELPKEEQKKVLSRISRPATKMVEAKFEAILRNDF